jgi:hypothetical protein
LLSPPPPPPPPPIKAEEVFDVDAVAVDEITEPLEDPPKGLSEPSAPVPNTALLMLKGDLACAGAAEVQPKIDLLSSPPPAPKADEVFDVGAVATVDVGATGAAPKGDVFSPPPKGDFEFTNEEVIFPKAKDEPVDDDGNDEGADFASNGLGVLYFTANFANISCSFPCFHLANEDNNG